MRLLPRRRRQEDFQLPAHLLDPANIVSSLRQRLHEDPEFKDTFFSGMKESISKDRQKSITESLANSEHYGDKGHELPDDIHNIRGSAFLALMGLLRATSEQDDFNAEDAVREIRKELGYAVSAAYSQGLYDIDPSWLDPNKIGTIVPGVGTVVVWERTRSAEAILDAMPSYDASEDTEGGAEAMQ